MNEPKISVIIPLYNAEKYIRQCLISVLASKFNDYEVLVVDDCSTDNSVAEVKKLLPHFAGRLKIFATEKNSSGPGLPRNIGIKNASSKYIVFVDADDMILPDALENLFETAETYGADVVHTEKWLVFDRKFDAENLKLFFEGKAENLVDKPTCAPAALNERMRIFTSGNFSCGSWGKIFRREFLTKNKIFFPQMRRAEDKIFCFECFCLAEKYFFVPFVTVIYRFGTMSASRIVMNLREAVRFWLKILSKSLGTLDEFMSRLALEPKLRRDVLKFFTETDFGIVNFSEEVPAHKLQKIFFDELENPELNPTGKNLLTAYLCTEKFLNR
ncbi:MAG: glycosyltransferase family 2 protein [Selenomonadaceae bacterium]|nr:glycosyltransferase family 2 protein [Selenomonadaceae bacterium]